jgi:flagellar hook-basal body complex protein FliE
MQILPVNSITSSAVSAKTAPSASGSTNFADILNDALNQAEDTETQDQLGNLALLSGDDTSIHTSMIDAQKAELALDLTIQIRNKVVDAYNEVMRMQL